METIPGSWPGFDGQRFVSTGLQSVDAALGGGLPLGSLLLIIEDAWSRHGISIARAFLAEGLYCRHQVLLCAPSDAPELAPEATESGSDSSSLENLTNWLPSLRQRGSGVPSSSGRTSKHAANDVPDLEDAAGGQSLRIAWQYRRYTGDLQVSSATSHEHRGPGGAPRRGEGVGRTPAGVRRLRQARDLARGQPPRHYPRHSKQAPPSSAARAGSLLTPHAEALKAGASKQRCQDWDLSARMASSNWRPDGTSARIAHGRSGALCPGGAPEDEALRASLAAALDARAEAERKSDGGRRERQGPQGGEGGAGQQSAGAQGRSGAGVASETGRKLHPLVAKRLAARAAALSGGDQGLLQPASSPTPPVTASRIAVLGLGDPAAPAGSSRALLGYIRALRGALAQSRGVAVVVLNAAGLPEQVKAAAAHLSSACLVISRLDEDSEVFRAARKGGGWQAAGLCQVVKVPSVMGMCRWLPTDAPMMVQHGKGTMRLADMTDALEAQ